MYVSGMFIVCTTYLHSSCCAPGREAVTPKVHQVYQVHYPMGSYLSLTPHFFTSLYAHLPISLLILQF